MAGISILVSRELRTVVQIATGLPRDIAANLRKWTKADALPIWRDEIESRSATKTQQSALVKTARVAVSDTNVVMKSAGVGKTHGTPNDVLKGGAEWGAFEDKSVAQRSSRGKAYTRRLGRVFRRPTPKGYIVHPAAQEATPRLAKLWFQTTYRTIADAFDKGAK